MAYRLLIDAVRGALFAVPVTVAFTDLIGSVSTVRGRSMQPTLNPGAETGDDGSFDVVWQNKWKIRFGNDYSRGSVVVFRNPYNPDERMVKRLIAVGGDWVRPQGDKYRLTNVPRGCCWVEGDNYEVSGDSNHFGPIPLALIEAKVTHVLWPPERAGEVSTKLPEVHQRLNPGQEITVRRSTRAQEEAGAVEGAEAGAGATSQPSGREDREGEL
ncbi:unnamed protein product [Discosporangium mesarthrocarpum]